MNENILQWKSAVDDAINKYARKLSKDRKEDLAQEIYLALLQSEVEVTTEDQVRRIAQDIMDSHRKTVIRERKREEKVSEEGVDGLDKKALALFRCGGEDGKLALKEALSKLPADLRAIIDDLFFMGFTQEESAAYHNKSREWVKWKKKEALAALRKILS